MSSRMIGHYELGELLGSGGSGEVFSAVDLRSGSLVAIKMLRVEGGYFETHEFERRFAREAEMLMSLPGNPHIVRYIAHGSQRGVHFLVMEYLDGQDLARVLARTRGPLTADWVVSVGVQIADALRAAHTHRVVHRDVKPKNVQITKSGMVKLIDFGIARPFDGTRLTQTGLLIGTPQYVAPEIWEGRPADQRSDLYALGVVMYESLAGCVPFDGTAPVAIMRKHLEGRPAPLKGISPALESIIRKSLARDPGQRFRSADELLTALYALHQPGSAGARSPARDPQQPAVAAGVTATPSEDCLVSALCHASAVLTIATTLIPVVPALTPLVVWLLARRSSSVVGFHARQAALFQVVTIAVLLLLDAQLQWVIWFVSTGYAWTGAWRCLRGRDFRYPLLSSIAHAVKGE